MILLCDDDFVGADRVRIHGRRARHVREVHRARPGDSLRVGRLNAQLGRGVITALADDLVEMTVVLDQPPPPALPLTLLLALPRPKSFKRVLQTIAAMGVKRVVLLNTWRVEKSFWDSPVLRPESVREQLVLGLEQGCDTVLPEVALRRRFKPFVEDELPRLTTGTHMLLAHPGAERPCPRGIGREATLAVGPEGGFIAYEIERFVACGFEPMTLGPRPLRVEQVVPALLSRLF